MRLTKQKTESAFYATTAELAKMFNCTARWINQLTNSAVLIKSGRDQYDVGSNVRAYAAYLENTKHSDYQVQQAEYQKVKRQIAEIDLLVAQNNLHRAEDVKLVMNNMTESIRARVLAIPDKLAPELISLNDKGAIEELLAEEICQALTELATHSPDTIFDAKTGKWIARPQ